MARVTKKDVEERDARIAELENELASRKREVQVLRDQLKDEYDTRLDQLDAALAAVTETAVGGIEIVADAKNAQLDEQANVSEFLLSALYTIQDYKGSDISVVHALAAAASSAVVIHRLDEPTEQFEQLAETPLDEEALASFEAFLATLPTDDDQDRCDDPNCACQG